MLDVINRYANGYVLIPLIAACRRGGLFELLEAAGDITIAQIAAALGANEGHLRVVLRSFESLGWIDRSEGGRIHATARMIERHSIPDTLYDETFRAAIRGGMRQVAIASPGTVYES